MGFVHVHNDFLMPSQILFCFIHNIFCILCVHARVWHLPAVQLAAAQEGSCSPHPSSTTPEMPWAAPQRKDCAVDTKHTQCLSGFYAYTVMSQSAVTTLSYHKSPDTMSLEVTLHCSSNINLDPSWSPPPPLSLCCHGSLPDWLVAGRRVFDHAEC